jgi:DNA modification methylase
MGTVHRVVFGDCRTMKEIPSESIQLTITSPPYYNAPFDYPGLFSAEISIVSLRPGE